LQGHLASWDVDTAWGQFEDEDGAADEGLFWCRPKLQRTKRAGGGNFVPSATDDFSFFGALATAPNSLVLQSSWLNPGPAGEGARYEAKQCALVTRFKHARTAGTEQRLR